MVDVDRPRPLLRSKGRPTMMMGKLSALLQRPFVRNVTTVATGAAASHAIALAFTPLITRLYGPEAYGLQGVFTSVVGIVAVAAALGYPTAIVLPRDEADAVALVRLSLRIGLGATLLTAVLLSLFGAPLLALINAQAIVEHMYWLPPAVLAVVLGRVLSYWLIRQQAYALGARFQVLTSLLVGSVKCGAGLVAPTVAVLIAANTLGALLGSALTFFGWRRSAAGRMPTVAAPLRRVALAHRDFPLLRAPQDLINTLSQSLPLLLLAATFGAGAAGHYAIAIAVLGVPAALIGNSVGAVFYPRITQAVLAGENARAQIVRATAALAAVGALPFGLVLAFGPWLFETAFGAAWRAAGAYAQWLTPWLFMQFINPPAVASVPALHLQHGLLIYEFFSTGSKAVALWLGFALFANDLAAVALFSSVGVLAYAWLIGWVVWRSATPPRAEATGAKL